MADSTKPKAQLERSQRRQRLMAEVMIAYDECAATGLHVTEAEADAWLDRLEAGESVEPPAAHT